MHSFLTNIIYSFLIAFGVIVGGSAFAGIGALINDHPPLKTMLDMSNSIKIWAVAVALGGTFTSFQIIEQGLLKGEMRAIIKQVTYILVALMGANLGYSFIKLVQKCWELWLE